MAPVTDTKVIAGPVCQYDYLGFSSCHVELDVGP